MESSRLRAKAPMLDSPMHKFKVCKETGLVILGIRVAKTRIKHFGDIGRGMTIDYFTHKKVMVTEVCNREIFMKFRHQLMDHGIVDQRIAVVRTVRTMG